MTGDSQGANREEPVTEGIAPAPSEQLQRGRAALQCHAWEEAFDALSTAMATGPVPAEDLEALAEAAYWTAHFDAELSALEAAYGAHIEANNQCRAAYIALQLATAHATKGAEAVARGWRSRAEQLEAMAEEYGTAFYAGHASQARGAVQLAQGQTDEAHRSLRQALKLWQEIDAPYETAQVRMLLAEVHRALGEQEDAIAELRTAQSLFERLGAVRDARRTIEELARLVSTPRDMGSKRTTRAFLFSDLVGSTNLVEAIGDDAWEALLTWHDRTLRSLFAEHRGREVDHAGDGFFVAFEDAGSALACAVAIQRGLAEHRRSHGFSPGVRIGVHLAAAIETGGSYKGKGVHEAARIAALAEGGEILTSQETLAAAGEGFAASAPRSVSLKGISKPIDVCAIAWR